MNIREEIAKYISHFSGTDDWDSHNRATQDYWRWEADQVLSHILSQIEQMEDPYLEDTAMSVG